VVVARTVFVFVSRSVMSNLWVVLRQLIRVEAAFQNVTIPGSVIFGAMKCGTFTMHEGLVLTSTTSTWKASLRVPQFVAEPPKPMPMRVV